VLTVAELFSDIIDDPSLDAAHLDTLARVIASHSAGRGPAASTSRGLPSSTDSVVAESRVGRPSFSGIDALAAMDLRASTGRGFDGVVDELVAADGLPAQKGSRFANAGDVGDGDDDDSRLLPGADEVLRHRRAGEDDEEAADIERYLALHSPRLARSRGEPQLDPAQRQHRDSNGPLRAFASGSAAHEL
jgi:hypothetical protein